MSIIKDSAPVYYPETDYSIAKYLDLTKFISLIQRNSLFFCRLEKLEDKLEGTVPKLNFESRVNWWKNYRESSIDNKKITDPEIIQNVTDYFEMEARSKSVNCINCWNKYDKESVALWKIYSDFNKGIMIKSSISRIENSLKESQEKIRMSEVNYIDYSKDVMIDGNGMYPFLHKHNAYDFEEEVRLIHEVEHIGYKFEWEKQEVEEGVYIKADLRKLIEEIIISPYSPNWFFELIKNLTLTYKLDIKVSKSSFSI